MCCCSAENCARLVSRARLVSTLRCLAVCLCLCVASGPELVEKQQGTIIRRNPDEVTIMLSVSRGWFHAILVFIAGIHSLLDLEKLSFKGLGLSKRSIVPFLSLSVVSFNYSPVFLLHLKIFPGRMTHFFCLFFVDVAVFPSLTSAGFHCYANLAQRMCQTLRSSK